MLAAYMPAAKLVTIDSEYGHDGFMVEAATISSVLGSWLAGLNSYFLNNSY